MAVAMASALLAGAARAEKEADYAQPTVPQGAAAAAGEAPARRVARPAFFAADAARTAVRLPPEAREERGFIRNAAASSRFEADASRLALAKSANPRVRELASALLEQHRATQLELAHLLQSRAMAMPMLDNEHVKVLKRLGKSGGTRFDREFLEQVGVKSHRDSIRNYEKASASLKDPGLKAWVDQKLPALRVNLLTAERAAGPQPTRLAGPGGAGIARVGARLSESNTR
jgi:predicted outer membrane protein